MKRLSKTGITLLVMAMMVFASCENNGGSGSGSEVDFWNHAANAAFLIDNGTNRKLVAFMESVAIGNLLGGIPAEAQEGGHGIWRNPDVFNRTQAFTVVLVTYDDFLANRNNLAVLNNAPFTRMFVFYDHGIDRPAHHRISEKLGGQNRLRVDNPTGLGAEIRLGGPNGPALGFVPAFSMAATFNVADGHIAVFPVFMRFNPALNEMVNIFPILGDGSPWFAAFTLGSAAIYSLNLPVIDLENVAYLTINDFL